MVNKNTNIKQEKAKSVHNGTDEALIQTHLRRAFAACIPDDTYIDSACFLLGCMHFIGGEHIILVNYNSSLHEFENVTLTSEQESICAQSKKFIASLV